MKLAKKYFSVLSLASLLLVSGKLSAEAPNVGVVSFKRCIEESEQGKNEQQSFEAVRRQMTSMLEKTEKELRDVSNKLNDQEYLDGLSPKAEEELKAKFQGLNEEMGNYQNQYYQMLQQANYRMIQSIGQSVTDAAEAVAKNKKLSQVFSDECFFYSDPALDVSQDVIQEMNKRYKEENPETPAATEEKKG